jgi:hypothetical protein
MVTEEELWTRYMEEHIRNPHVERNLAFANWKRLYLRFRAIENRLDSVKPGTSLFEKLDSESQRLAGILGY